MTPTPLDDPQDIQFPANLKARLLDAGVTDEASLLAAVARDPALKRDFRAFIAAQDPTTSLVLRFVAARSDKDLLALWREVPRELEAPLIDEVEALIAAAEQGGQSNDAETLRQKLEAFRQIQKLGATSAHRWRRLWSRRILASIKDLIGKTFSRNARQPPDRSTSQGAGTHPIEFIAERAAREGWDDGRIERALAEAGGFAALAIADLPAAAANVDDPNWHHAVCVCLRLIGNQSDGFHRFVLGATALAASQQLLERRNDRALLTWLPLTIGLYAATPTGTQDETQTLALLGTLHYELGNALDRQLKYSEAEIVFRITLAIYTTLAQHDARFDRQVGGAWHRIGNALVSQLKHAEAEFAYKQALAIFTELAECDEVNAPEEAATWHGIGNALLCQLKHSEAEAAYRHALAIYNILAQRDPVYAPRVGTMWRWIGNALSRQLKHAEAEDAFRKALAIFAPLALRDQGFAKNAGEAWLGIGNALDDQLKPSEAEAALRLALSVYSILAQRDPGYAIYVGGIWHGIGNALVSRLKYVEAEAAFREGLAIYTVLAQRDPVYVKDVADEWHWIGNALLGQLKHAEAEGAFSEGLAIYKVLAQGDAVYAKDVADALQRIGDALASQLKHVEAEAVFRHALSIYSPLAQRDPVYAPKVGTTWNGIGYSLLGQLKHAEAEAAFRQTLEIYTRLAQRDSVFDKYVAHAWHWIGRALLTQLKHVEAEAAYRQALTINDSLARRDPEYAKDVGMTWHGIGNALNGQLKHAEAEDAFRQAVPIFSPLAQRETAYALLLGGAWHGIGNALLGQLKHAEAEAAFRNALAIFAPLAEHDARCVQDVGHAWHGIGNALLSQLKHAAAEAAFRQTLAVFVPLAQRDPVYSKDVGMAWHGIGNALLGQLKPAEAEDAFRNALAIYETLARRDPVYAKDVGMVWQGIGNALNSQMKHAEAEAAVRLALAIYFPLAQRDPVYAKDVGGAWHGIGNALFRQLKHAEAEAAFRQALAIYETLAQRDATYSKDAADEWHGIGNALEDQLKPAEAEAAFRNALAIYETLARRNPVYAPHAGNAWHGIGNALVSQLKPIEAEDAFRNALDIFSPLAQRDPVHAKDVANAWHGIGNALDRQLKHAEAEAAFRNALAIYETLARRDLVYAKDMGGAWHGIGNALDSQLKHAEAEAAFRNALDIFFPLAQRDPVYAKDVGSTWHGIGNALDSQLKHAEAEAAYRNALALTSGRAESGRWLTLSVLAELLMGRAAHAEACELLRTCLTEIAAARADIGLLQDRNTLQETYAHTYRLMVRCCLDLGRPDEAWFWAERGKAATLRDLFATAPIRLTPDRRAPFDTWQRLKKELAALSRHREDDDNLIRAARLKDVQTQEELAYQALLASLSPAERRIAIGDVPAPPQLRQRLATLAGKRKTLLVNWFSLGESLVIFAVPLWSPDAPIHVTRVKQDINRFGPLAVALRFSVMFGRKPPSPDDARAQRDAFQAALAEHLESALGLAREIHPTLEAQVEAGLHKVGDAVLAPVINAIHANGWNPDALLLVPHGVLHQLPLHACPIIDPQTGQPQLLIERFSLVYLPSAALADALLDARTPPSPSARLALGPAHSSGPQALPGAELESRALAAAWGHPPFVDADMQVDLVRQHRAALQRLHIASHSRFDPVDFTRSAIQFHDHDLQVRDIMLDGDIDFAGMRLLYLSSCESAASDPGAADEVQALAFALMRAGARAVLASQWAVDDSAAAIMAREFYRRLDSGIPAMTLADAYRRAILQLREREGGKAHLWAPFILIGDALVV